MPEILRVTTVDGLRNLARKPPFGCKKALWKYWVFTNMVIAGFFPSKV